MKIESKREVQIEKSSSSMEAASETESPSPQIIIPEEWSNAADAIARGPVYFTITLVCGPKNSGKTTFARHLVNVLLQRYFIGTLSLLVLAISFLFLCLMWRVDFRGED